MRLSENGKPGDIGWNFTKFLVSKQGEVIERFEPKTTPEEIADARCPTCSIELTTRGLSLKTRAAFGESSITTLARFV